MRGVHNNTLYDRLIVGIRFYVAGRGFRLGKNGVYDTQDTPTPTEHCFKELLSERLYAPAQDTQDKLFTALRSATGQSYRGYNLLCRSS